MSALITSTRHSRTWGWRPPAAAAPVLCVALGLVAFILLAGGLEHFSVTRLVVFGRAEAGIVHPPAGARLVAGSGYDGQLYWLQAHDPLLRHTSTLHDLARGWPGYHLQRVAYPALAWLFAGGRDSLLPWTMLGINVVAILAASAAVAVYAQRHGASPWWALAAGLAPGMLLPALRDLSDVLAISAAVIALVLWDRGRVWWAAFAVTVAVLSREPMLLLIPALGLDVLGRCRRARRSGDRMVATLARLSPAPVLPAMVFFAWDAYIHTLHSSAAAVGDGTGTAASPFMDFVTVVEAAVHTLAVTGVAWIAVFVVLTLVGMATAAWFAVRVRSAAAWAALLLSLTLPVIDFADQWGLARYSAPMFAMLLLVAIERRSRPALWLCGTVAAMTIMVPTFLI